MINSSALGMTLFQFVQLALEPIQRKLPQGPPTVAFSLMISILVPTPLPAFVTSQALV